MVEVIRFLVIGAAAAHWTLVGSIGAAAARDVPAADWITNPSGTVAMAGDEDEPKEKDGARGSPESRVRAKVGTTPVALSDKPIHVTLEPQPEREGEEPIPIPARVKSLGAGRRLYLILKNLRTNAQPGVVYSIYLELPSGASREVSESHHVGTINFFDAVDRDGGRGAKKRDRFVSFDVTDLAKELRSKGKLKEKPTLTIVPAGQPAAAAKPVIGEITLVEQ
jgi:hypothetical protein